MQTQNTKITQLVLISAGLVLLIGAAFEPLRHNDFIDYDDNDYITENPHIQSGLTWPSARWAFTSGYVANWHPLTWLSHMVDIELFGLNPLGHHLHNLLLHTTSTVLLFWLLYKMTGAVWCSAFVAMVFGIHPLRVESVAWAAERKDVLSMFFFMLTLAAYLYYVKKRGIGQYLLVLFCFALGLMAKPMLVTVPILLLLLDFWPLNRIHYSNNGAPKDRRQFSFSVLAAEKIPLFILTLISCVITYLAQQHGRSVATTEEFPVLFRVLNTGISYLAYIGKTAWPRNLVILYPFPEAGFRISSIVTAFTALLVIFGYVIFQYRRKPYLLTGWLWYIVTLIPVIGLIHVGSQRMADRYTYLPSIGIYLIVTCVIDRLSKTLRYRKIILWILSITVITALTATTRTQLSYWKNSITLYEHALSIIPENPVIESNLGMALLGENRVHEASGYISKVLTHHPDDPYANINMALILIHRGQSEQSVDYLRKALKSPMNNVASYFRTGMLFQLVNQYDDAIGAYEKTIELAPDHAQALNNLGVLKSQKGMTDIASKYFRRSIDINPSYADAHRNYAVLLQTTGHTAEAAEQFRISLGIDPNDYTVSYALASISVQSGNIPEAILHFRETLRLKSDYSPALNDLAWVLAAAPDISIRNPHEAVTLAQKACLLTDFENPSFLDTLGVAYAANGRFKEAIATVQKGLEQAATAKQADLAGRMEKRMQSYQALKPYYDPPPKQ